MPNPVGRPREFDDDAILAILDRHAAGESLGALCREKGAPSFQVVTERCALSPDLGRRLLSAREEFAHAQVDEAQRIADTDVDAPRARNRIHIRTWRAERFAPQTFGAKLELDVKHTVSVGAALEEARRRVRPISDLSERALPQVIDLQAETIDAPTDTKSGRDDVDPFD